MDSAAPFLEKIRQFPRRAFTDKQAAGFGSFSIPVDGVEIYVEKNIDSFLFAYPEERAQREAIHAVVATLGWDAHSAMDLFLGAVLACGLPVIHTLDLGGFWEQEANKQDKQSFVLDVLTASYKKDRVIKKSEPVTFASTLEKKSHRHR